VALATTSPEDLQDQLSTLSPEEKQKKYITLAVSGAEVLVQLFEVPFGKVRQVKEQLLGTAVELLNLPVNQIAFDFQIFSSSENKTSGVFVCVPKSIIENYLLVIQAFHFVPFKIIPYILSSINAFYLQNEAHEKRFCLLDFSRDGYINLAVINQQNFEVLRKVPYEHNDEGLFEVTQSLRCACARSAVKHFDHIFFSGVISEKDRFIDEIEKTFETKAVYKDSICIKSALASEETFFSLNFVRETTLTMVQRQKILNGINAVVLLALIGTYFLGVQIYKTDKLIKELNSQNVTYRLNYVQSMGERTKEIL